MLMVVHTLIKLNDEVWSIIKIEARGKVRQEGCLTDFYRTLYFHQDKATGLKEEI